MSSPPQELTNSLAPLGAVLIIVGVMIFSLFIFGAFTSPWWIIWIAVLITFLGVGLVLRY